MNRSVVGQVLIHALAAAALALLPALWLEKSVLRATQWQTAAIAAAFAATYFICAIALLAFEARGGRARLARPLLAGAAAFGAAFLAMAIAQAKWPTVFTTTLPLLPVAISILGIALLVVLFAVRGATLVKILALAAAVGLGMFGQVRMTGSSMAGPVRDIVYLDSSLYALKQTVYRNSIDDGSGRGGGIATYRDGHLVADGLGALHIVRETDKGSLEVETLPHRVPLNTEEFQRGAEEVLGDKWRGPGRDYWFNPRIGDLLVQPREDGSFRLYVSHHFWKTQERCAVVRVSVLEGSDEQLRTSPDLKWRTLYDTTPCLQLNPGGRGLVFGALQIGGAMGLLGDEYLLIAVGDHEFDGWNRTPALPQDPASPYGKVMRIRTDTGEAEMYSLGLRNPQGMYVDPAGEIWTTEHGPRGGDELNHIRQGANYGWPKVTYGTDYGLHNWPLNSIPGRHDGFEQPTVAFLPSLAATGVIGINGDRFGAWKGDLVIASLDAQLKRVRLVDGHAVVVEPLRLGTRNRDIAQGADGKIVVWTDANDLIFIEPAGTGDGESLVFQCTSCHTIQDWEKAGIGPNLLGVVGRKVASADDYDYSPAMKAFGGRWTRERLDEFLANPSGTVPGTTMVFPGMPDPAQRRQLIDFLERHD
jgi:cytochrome c2